MQNWVKGSREEVMRPTLRILGLRIYISITRTVEARNLKFGMQICLKGTNETYKIRQRVGKWSRYFTYF